MKNLIDFCIIAGFLLSQSLGLAIALLQLLQSKPYIINTGFIRSFTGKLGLKNILKMPELWQSVGFAD